MRDDLNYTLAGNAAALIADGDKLSASNCMTCQGHSMPSVSVGFPGHCPECLGTGLIVLAAWKRWTDNRKLDYWQARALVAELALQSQEIDK